ncbi:metal ABC transporter ATP-binding protein [Enterovirga rhinocerotis]|uniref:metal ABC transporter ATP-binding protein n=1 Tax=Enterovirga rhinocerotis TaxID=1339210 RepID=UPI00105F1539
MDAAARLGPAPSIEVHDLSVAYPDGHVALSEVTLRLDAGRICGLVGPNGSGKSTLFKAIMGFVRPVRGEVRIGGQDVRAAQKANAVAYVPQSEEVDWTFPVSVRDVVMMGRQGRMGFLRRPSPADRAVVGQSLDRVGMAAFGERQIGELSGGQRKRVFLARALAQEAGIILLDEPFTGVDQTTEEEIIGLLRGLREAGHLLLVSTHDLAAVPDFCDDVVLLSGTVIAAGPTADAFTPANLARAFGRPPPGLASLAAPKDVPGTLREVPRSARLAETAC